MNAPARRSPLLPPGEWRGLARNFGLVGAGALVISLVTALVQAAGAPPRYGIAAAYAFGISWLTWAFIDIGRLVLRGPLGACAPGYWPSSRAKALALTVPGIMLGYLGGTSFGDWAAGRSTFELLTLNPTRFVGILVASLGVSLASVAYFVQRGKGESLARQAQQARLDLLVSQLEPHMLFNTLANLRVLIARDPARAQAMLDHLVGYLRTTLAASRTTTHPLAAEFARSADYLALMGVRMGPRLQVRMDLPEALRDVTVPTLLLQPLVENAIAHGLEPAVHGGRVEITARLQGSAPGPVLELCVRDTGVGLGDATAPGAHGAQLAPTASAAPAAEAHTAPMTRSVIAAGTGYGLTHVRERLATLYGTRASLHLARATDAEGGTVATLRLPAEPDQTPPPNPDRMIARTHPTALVADDEPLLALGLQADLAALWPELQIVACVHDGFAAFEQALTLQPDLCFLDIRMPGQDGLDVARAMLEDWPVNGRAFPLLVFVTAYDQHALAAFEAQAVDYLVKPVEPERLGRCVSRLKALLARVADPADAARTLERALDQLRGLAARAAQAAAPTPGGGAAPNQPEPPGRLTVIQAQIGNLVHMVPVEDVFYFEAADKYVRVVTAEREHLIRMSLRELLPRLDPAVFWQVHRSTVVQARCVASAQREESGIVRLRLRGHKDVLTASRLFAHLFRGL